LRVASKSWARNHFPSRTSPNCERWISDVTNGRQISSATDHYQEVTYEELSSDGAAVLKRLLAGMGVPSSLDQCRRYVDECSIENLKAGKLDNAPFAMTNRNEGYRIGATDSWRVELSKRQIALIEHRAGPLMSELGFTRTKVSKATSIFVSMGWATWEVARAAKRMLRNRLR
jgi:hypothetical protein